MHERTAAAGGIHALIATEVQSKETCVTPQLNASLTCFPSRPCANSRDTLAGLILSNGNEKRTSAHICDLLCGKNPGARRTDLQPPWRRFRKRATVRLWARTEGSTSDLVHRLEREHGSEPTYDECIAAAKENLDLPTGLVDVRIHDLRHSFASGAVALGDSLPMIGKLLGHRRSACRCSSTATAVISAVARYSTR
jgi:hypothetical protein